MQIVELNLNHLYFYCPATGECILDPKKSNDVAKSLMGYWVDEDLYLPLLKNKNLEKKFNKFISKQELKDDFTIDCEVLEKFLKKYNEANWVCFKITTKSMACGPNYSTVYLIINMDTHIN